MDIVWLKRDVRLHDHGPLATALQRNDRPGLILYLYEPDQLAESSVHGSHVAFAKEGLLDLEKRLCHLAKIPRNDQEEFQLVTVCHAEIVATLQAIAEKTAHCPSFGTHGNGPHGLL